MTTDTSPEGGDSGHEFDWLTLDDDEEIIWVGEPHFYSIVPALVIGIPLSLLLIGIPIVLGAYLSRENTTYLLTSEGLYRKRGILSRDVQKIEFEKVQNISFSQGPLGTYVGYGNVDISTAGGSGVEMQFRAVPDPKTVQERVNREIRRSRSRDRGDDDEGESARGKADVMEDVLAELRAIRTAIEERDGRVEPQAADRDASVDTSRSGSVDDESVDATEDRDDR